MEGASGSKIVVTTRSNKVATIMGTVPKYILRGHSHQNCLSLFVKWAFKDGEGKDYPNLIKIGDEIVKSCGGVPLAVRTLGSLLYTKTDERDWLFIENNEMWRLEQKENDILPMLKLSYDHLSPHLQQCFAYCSLFPKDYLFHNQHLIYYWMATGVLGTLDGNKELEDVGLEYLKELISRCFFQDVTDHGFCYTFKMHDLMHDLSISMAQKECAVLNFGDQIADKRVRHFSILDSKNITSEEIPALLKNSTSIRTILFQIKLYKPVSTYFFDRFISKLKYLRMLDLSGMYFMVLPDSIGTLKLLKYLNLSRNNGLRTLPESICQLQSLQTLNLLDCRWLQKLPDYILLMVSLRCLEITTNNPHEWCLPEFGIGWLSSLRYLYLRKCIHLRSLFQGMRCLSNPRTLQIGLCMKLVSLPRGMKYLTRLENLVLWGCPKLDLRMDTLPGEEPQDLQLNLQTFIIYGLPQLVDLPQLILQGSATTLQYIQIEQCWNITALPEWLQHLTSLDVLAIRNCPRLVTVPDGLQGLISTDPGELKFQAYPSPSDIMQIPLCR